VGKAACPMALSMEELLGDYLNAGVVITKEGHLLRDAGKLVKTSVLEARHPVPDQRGVDATRELIKLVQSAGENDLVICLISGGGSALMTSPVSGLELEDLQKLTGLLLRSGATIDEINALRKHLDEVKGGGLAKLAAPAALITLVLSDVVGDPLDVIASGPTVPDTSSFMQCWVVLNKYKLVDQIPYAVKEHLRAGKAGEIPETLKPGNPIFEHNLIKIIGSNSTAAHAAVEEARRQGLQSLLLTSCLQGEAREAGKMIAAVACQIALTGEPLSRPCCIVIGGETTVTVHSVGKGGRNTELALGAVETMAGLKNMMLVTLATDGGDGPTDAAGAVVTGETHAFATETGFNPDQFLDRNDSYTFFEKLHDLVITGPTRTNVNDLSFIFAF
jgi:glycerate 2-kinase